MEKEEIQEIITGEMEEREIESRGAAYAASLYVALSKYRDAKNKIPGAEMPEVTARVEAIEALAGVLLCAELIGLEPRWGVRPPYSVEGIMICALELALSLQNGVVESERQSVLLAKVKEWCGNNLGCNHLDLREEIEEKKKRSGRKWAERIEKQEYV